MKPTNPVQASGLKRLLKGEAPHGMAWPELGAYTRVYEPVPGFRIGARKLMIIDSRDFLEQMVTAGGRPQWYEWLCHTTGC